MYRAAPVASCPASLARKLIMPEPLKRLRAPLIVLLGMTILLAEIAVSYRGRGAASAAAPGGTGPTWQLIGLPGATVHSLALSPTQPGTIFAGTETGVYRRQPAGHWVQLLAHRAIWSLAVLPDGHTLLAADQNGTVDISADGGVSWQDHFLNSDGVFAVTARPGVQRILLAGAGSGVYLSRDGGSHWQRRLALQQSAGAAFAWLPGSNRIVFAGVVASGAQGNTQVFVSRDAGTTWLVYGRGLHSAGGIMSLGVSSSGQVLAGTMGQAIWSASGGTWRQIAAGMPTSNNHVAAIAVIPGAPQQIVIGTLALGVFRSRDGGQHWIRIAHGLPAVGTDQIVLSLAYAADRSTLYAGTFQGIYAIPLREQGGAKQLQSG